MSERSIADHRVIQGGDTIILNVGNDENLQLLVSNASWTGEKVHIVARNPRTPDRDPTYTIWIDYKFYIIKTEGRKHTLIHHG